MKLLINAFMFAIFSLVRSQNETCSSNNCITFSLGQGTGCAWMCNYCATHLGTNNYYFTNNVCTYESGVGFAGSPVAGASYTCCSN